MDHIYAHFTCELQGHFDMFAELPLKYQAQATELDISLFDRLLELNPNMALKEYDPKKYHKKDHLYSAQNYCNQVPLPRFLESKAIIEILLSRFLFDQPKDQPEQHQKDYFRIEETIKYIKENSDQKITVKQLAEMASFTPDHYSRIFKKIMAVSPIEYIQRLRIQRAKLLLLTTDKSIEQIAYEIGFDSASYFLRVFKKYMDTTPKSYRKNATLG